jgi:pilus assembly protein CpaC
MKTDQIRLSAMVVLLTVVFMLSTERTSFAEGPMEYSGGTQSANPSAPKRKRSRLTSDDTESSADRRRLIVNVGEDRVIDLDFDARLAANGVSVGNPKVLSYTLVKVGERRQLVFRGLSVGETTVTVRDEDGVLQLIVHVRVNGTNLDSLTMELRELLKDIEGIKIRSVGKKIVIDGEVYVPADYRRLFSVVRPYEDPANPEALVLNLVQMSPVSLKIISDRIKKEISTFAPNVTTRVVNSQIWLEGSVDDRGAFTRVMKVASLHLPDVKSSTKLLGADERVDVANNRDLIQQFIVINPAPPRKADKLVRVTFHFVELSKDYQRLFGFKWQPGFTGDPSLTVGQTEAGSTGASGGTSFTATISSLFPKLQSAQQAGYARVLKTATVLVRSGLPAKVNDQTEFPTVVAGANGTVQAGAPVNIGLSLAVTPSILGQSDDIELKADIEQSSQVGQSGSTPIRALHRVNTTLYVKSFESAAIAGANSQDVLTNFNKDEPNPGSFQGPTGPLFTLTRSKNYKKKKGQFVIFVTPQIVTDASEGTSDLKKNFRVKVK